MSNKFIRQVQQLSHRAGDALSIPADKASAFVQENKPGEQEITRAKDLVRSAASVTAVEATRPGKEVMKSGMAKDMAKGAAAGAVIAVPVPFVGPVFGAVVRAGFGVFANLTRSNTVVSQYLPPVATQPTTVIEMVAPAKDVYVELMKVDDLLKKGILAQEEFDVEKKKLLDGS